MTNPNDNTPEMHTVEAQIEVPGTPQQVWEAIATSAGVSAWFVPAEIEERQGGRIALDFGGGMEGSGVISAWDPPHRFVGEEEWGAGRLATEYLVEARSRDTCVVRIVSSLFGTAEDWERELGSMQEGWGIFLRNLRRYLADFAGRPAATVMVQGTTAGPRTDAWADLADAVGLGKVAVGERVQVAIPGAAAVAGVVEWVADGQYHDGVMLHIDQPAPGTATIFVNSWRDRVFTNLHAHLYGDDAAAVAALEQAAWRAWMEERFPVAVGSG